MSEYNCQNVLIVVRRSGVISIYAFLEQRLGRESRLLASACFLFFRGIATGVTVYGVASVLSLVTGLSYLVSVLLLMGITILYDVLGGMRAVVVSTFFLIYVTHSFFVLRLSSFCLLPPFTLLFPSISK